MNRSISYRLTFGIIAFLSIGIGLYPLLYFIGDMGQGFLSQKSDEILANMVWQAAFYTHISFGGISLLTGWSQFSKTIRNRRLRLHRLLGTTYVVSVALSGLAALYLAIFANGGIIPKFGFGIPAIIWIYFTYMAYRSILFRDINVHEKWMYRSFALTLAAVTLRLWMPLLVPIIGMDPGDAYRLVSWLCWVPNVVIAEVFIRKYL